MASDALTPAHGTTSRPSSTKLSTIKATPDTTASAWRTAAKAPEAAGTLETTSASNDASAVEWCMPSSPPPPVALVGRRPATAPTAAGAAFVPTTMNGGTAPGVAADEDAAARAASSSLYHATRDLRDSSCASEYTRIAAAQWAKKGSRAAGVKPRLPPISISSITTGRCPAATLSGMTLAGHTTASMCAPTVVPCDGAHAPPSCATRRLTRVDLPVPLSPSTTTRTGVTSGPPKALGAICP
mmetsp:Transcript_25187/g.77764  ORF Transcript_25187/g.77764 Transcript_25187/m.77764 type:complete len:242 (+) Transcript_25187:454-1179(+)